MPQTAAVSQNSKYAVERSVSGSSLDTPGSHSTNQHCNHSKSKYKSNSRYCDHSETGLKYHSTVITPNQNASPTVDSVTTQKQSSSATGDSVTTQKQSSSTTGGMCRGAENDVPPSSTLYIG
ncbi:hypothetical protein NDU88_007057 [Pleurodeles waltl]|uniref:Uncharacterized protein n=1 Tax=Pleurodeles waltl TaxID=8319 RepID=A0AAV7SRH5_PLEWA|nr:hypothetical protein NDU88_007057 [Pleurodeles waltl]